MRPPVVGVTDELAVEWTGVDGTRRRVQIIPDTSGREGWRIEEEWTGVSWREIGREPISDVEIAGTTLEV